MSAPSPSINMRALHAQRGLALIGLVLVVGVYSGLRPMMRSDYAATALNDVAWWLVALIAAIMCGHTARLVPIRERMAWRILAIACAAWVLGQTVWTYYEVVQGKLPAFPHWMQLLFSAYDWLFVVGLIALPRPDSSKQLTPRHLGNLVLILCTLGSVLVIVLLEPALVPTRNSASNLVIATHCLGLSAMFVTALYLLWSHSWRELYWPIVLLLFGAGLHTGTYIAYVHNVMIGRYVASNWINASWIFVFGAYSAAAYERVWQLKYVESIRSEWVGRRERILEATIPALLIALMIAVGWFYREWLTDRSARLAILPAIGFAIALGLREAWIQRQEQRLLKNLQYAGESMQSANRDLQQSEQRYRMLNAELEARVAERTAKLKDANRELENFSYAVAHDLKAPLRAIDGFGSMLASGHGDRLDATGQLYLQRMRNSALKMSELIDDLLTYASVDRREFDLRPLELRELLEEVTREQHDEMAQAGVELLIDVPAVAVVADKSGLLMAYRNLLQNALKFSGHARPPRIAIAALRNGADIVISLRDNGVGFDMAYSERIFEMFQRLHRADEFPGTGIGLAIVRKAVERMGGSVWAESRPGEGAAFFVRLRVAEK